MEGRNERGVGRRRGRVVKVLQNRLKLALELLFG